MARIYDNIDTKFSEGLQGIITNIGVRRVDFCVGYFNLRGSELFYAAKIAFIGSVLLK